MNDKIIYGESPQIWLILPTLNEEENLKWLLPLLIGHYRIAVVDNYSSDQSAAVARSLKADLVHCRSQGYGSAILAGISFISSQLPRSHDIIVVFDADGTSPVDQIPNLIQPIAKGKSDFVIAQRAFYQVGAMPIHARFGNWLTVNSMKFFTGYRFKDLGPLRAIRWDALTHLKMSDKTWGWNVEMQMKAVYMQISTSEINVEYLSRKFGTSKISGSLIGSIKAGYKILFRTLFYFVEYKVVGYPTFKSADGK